MQLQDSALKTSQQAAEATEFLGRLIAIPSFSRQEEMRADFLFDYLGKRGLEAKRKKTNVWACNRHFSSEKPTILLNSHLDTVKPAANYTRDPFIPEITDGKLFGLGSNDAGGALVSLLQVFLHYYERDDLKYNLIFAATAEEEISGADGIELLLQNLPKIDFAFVGEPTSMQMAIAEKGLLVIDCIARGKSGHAARDEGENAIYKALKDIDWFRSYEFPELSPLLGKVNMNVTMVQAGSQHNVIPGECHFTVDIRLTDTCTHEEVLDIIRENVSCEVTPRSLRLKPSSVSTEHPFIQTAKELGIPLYGSPTLSDQALMPFPSVKMGPGDFARSHTADEFIWLHEIEEAIPLYISLFDKILFS